MRKNIWVCKWEKKEKNKSVIGKEQKQKKQFETILCSAKENKKILKKYIYDMGLTLPNFLHNYNYVI